MRSMPVVLPEPALRVTGPLYRALNPVWARDPLSGQGAALHGGRFNRRGQPALYTALSIMGAVAEANQIGRPFEPVTLVSYDADLGPVFDATDPEALAIWGIAPDELAAGDWRLQMQRHGLSAAQRIAAELVSAGFVGMRVPSFARGAAADARNLVLWHWHGLRGCQGLRVTDTEGRLAP